MSRIDIAEVTAFHRDLQQMNREARSAIQKMEQAAMNYAQDNSLKGQAVTTSKHYFAESYRTICDTVIEVMNESEHLLARYIQDFHSQVDPSPNAKIDAEMLQEAMAKIRTIERKKEHLQQSLSGSTAGLHEGQMQQFRMQMTAAVKQEKILEKYIHFEQSHGNFFSTIEELIHRAGKVVRQLLRETQFNEKTGKIYLPTGYGKSLKDLKKSLAKARGIDPKMEKKLKSYTVYAVVVPGANGKSSVMWITEKDGLAVNEADLQSYLDKCGKYLKPSEYYVIPNEVLLQKINDAWKHGQYYLDGKVKFGAGAKGILSASAYVEDWAERFNKSEFGQAVLGLGLSAASIRYSPKQPVKPGQPNQPVVKIKKTKRIRIKKNLYYKRGNTKGGAYEVKLPPLENGPYIRNGKPYGRPTLSGKKRLEFEQAVYDRQVGPDGVLRDPNTGEVIDWKPGQPRKGKVDFGHDSGRSYKTEFARYKNREITLEELKEFQSNPDNFRIESPNANRSHKYE